MANFKENIFTTRFADKFQLTFIKNDLIASIFILFGIVISVLLLAKYTFGELYLIVGILLVKAIIYYLVVKEKKEIAAHLLVISEFLTIILVLLFLPQLKITVLGFVLLLFTPFIVLDFNSKSSYIYALLALIALFAFSTYFYFSGEVFINSDKYKNIILISAIFFIALSRIIFLSNLLYNNLERLSNNLKLSNTLYKNSPFGVIVENKQNNEISYNQAFRKSIDFSNVAENEWMEKILNKPNFENGKWNSLNFSAENKNYLVRKDKITDDIDLTWLQQGNEVKKSEKIEESSQIYEIVIENVYDAIVIVKYNERTKVANYNWNKKFGDLLELEENEKDINIFDFFPEKQLDNVNSKEKYLEIHKKRKKKKFQKTKWQFITKSKKMLYTSLTTVRNVNGEHFNTIILINDETEQYNYKTDLITKESLYNNLIKNSYAGVIIDVENNTTGQKNKICNNKVNEIFKVKEKGKEITSFKPYYPKFQDNGKNSLEEYRKMSQILEREGKVDYEWKIFDEERNLIYLYVQSSIQNIDVNNTLCITYITDITSEKSKEETIKNQISELKIKNKRLQEYFDSNQSLEGFAYKAAHDLKSPLRNVSGFAQLLERRVKEKLNSEEEEYLSFIINSSKNMQQLIDDLLDYARMEKTDIEGANITTINLLNRVEFELREEIAKHKVSIISKELPQIIYGEMALIKRLFIELIKHAIRNKAENRNLEIEISCEVLESQFLFKLKDNTKGFNEKSSDKIFEAFANFGGNKNSSVMSMAICKKIVTQHGGEIWAESKLDIGTTFYFSLRNEV